MSGRRSSSSCSSRGLLGSGLVVVACGTHALPVLLIVGVESCSGEDGVAGLVVGDGGLVGAVTCAGGAAAALAGGVSLEDACPYGWGELASLS